jgi:2-polyprenyl-6-methoxyphenol hydroxylase-like FAD-dependent oxidoreductase
VARWRSVSDIARHYQLGHVFIVGDAAHVMPPNGDFGGNTGIHDAAAVFVSHADSAFWHQSVLLQSNGHPSRTESYR